MPSAQEIAITNIWKEILGVQDVAPDEDFFELGGTSLHAARVVTKTRAAFGVKLPAQTSVRASHARRLPCSGRCGAGFDLQFGIGLGVDRVGPLLSARPLNRSTREADGQQLKQILDFIVIGAQRCGTTSLFEFIRGHPELAVPPEKEMP